MLRGALPLALLPFAFDVVYLALNPGLLPPGPFLEFSLPLPFPTLAQVLGPGPETLSFFPLYPPPEAGQLSTVLLLATLGVQAYLTAGYLGTLEVLRVGGSLRAFFRRAAHLFSRLFAFTALVAVLLLAPFVSQTPDRLVSLFVLLAVLVVLYFLFLTPFGIAVDDLPLGVAFRRSLEYAFQSWREVVPFVLAYAGVTALASLAVQLLFILPPFLALPAAAAFFAVLGTGLTLGTLHLYEGLVPKEVLPTAVPRPQGVEEAAST